ncbi:MAG: type I-D CRISPR-associated helicase Cas3' [Chloroflexi bacterium]|nr:type I-D CRISPR-associated helicase Cas3' [Chloroflexota bacterium]
MKIDALTLSLYDHPEASRPVYAHQAAMLDAWNAHDTFLVVTRTGTGKTLAAMLPVLRERRFAIAVYPTNALASDQVRAVARMAGEEGLAPYVWEPGQEDRRRFANADVILTPLDADRLERWRKSARHATKGQALSDVLSVHGKKPGTCGHIVFVNPDMLFLLLAARYRRGVEALAALGQYSVLILDEFHLYQGVELAHALFMAHLARSLGVFEKLLLLSATPPPELLDILRRLWDPVIVDSMTPTVRPQIGSRVAVHDVSLVAVPAQAEKVEVIEAEVRRRVERWRALHATREDAELIPGLVIVDSVVNAIWLEDRLRQDDFVRREELLIVRGLSHRATRTQTGQEIAALGTAAIEVGIDFKAADLIFEASDAASLLQRIGRAGRHGPSDAILIAPANVLNGIERLPAHVDRATFEENVYQWYPRPQTQPWFVETLGGWYTIRSMARGLIRMLRRDHHATDEEAADAEKLTESILESFAQRLGGDHPKFKRRSGRHFEEAERYYPWLLAYERLGTFRTSLPSIWVRDAREARRRSDPRLGTYQADLKILLHRGRDLEWLPNEPVPDGSYGAMKVQGYGKWQKVDIVQTFTPDDVGQFFRMHEKPHMHFLQNRHPVPGSNAVMGQDHIFTVVKQTDVAESDVDWRLPAFQSGEFLVAFDGAALLLSELAQRPGS